MPFEALVRQLFFLSNVYLLKCLFRLFSTNCYTATKSFYINVLNSKLEWLQTLLLYVLSSCDTLSFFNLNLHGDETSKTTLLDSYSKFSTLNVIKRIKTINNKNIRKRFDLIWV